MTRHFHTSGLMAWLLGALSGFLLLGPDLASAQTRYVPTEESRVWIEGTSNAQDFTCATGAIEGRALLPAEGSAPAPETGAVRKAAHPAAPERRTALQPPTLRATVPVETLDCGKRRQNRDLYKAMKADRYPTIHYKLLGVEAVRVEAPDSVDGNPDGRANDSRDSSATRYVLHTTGELIIAGERQTVQTELQGRYLDDGRVRARGSMPIEMSDFGIDPPTALLGLIRVRDEITVHFDITAVVDEQP